MAFAYSVEKIELDKGIEVIKVNLSNEYCFISALMGPNSEYRTTIQNGHNGWKGEKRREKREAVCKMRSGRKPPYNGCLKMDCASETGLERDGEVIKTYGDFIEGFGGSLCPLMRQ